MQNSIAKLAKEIHHLPGRRPLSAILGIGLCLCPASPQAATCTWRGDAAGAWSTSGNWDTVPKGSDDTVVVPAGATLPVGDADAALAASVDTIRLMGADSQVVYDISTDIVSHPKITDNGMIVKRGTGVLEFENRASASLQTCAGGIVIERGIVRLPRGSGQVGSGNNYTVRKVSVGADGMLETVNTTGGTWTTINELTGSGIVTNRGEFGGGNLLQISGATRWHEFSGTITGSIRFFPVGYINLTGTDNNPAGSVILATYGGSHVGVKTFDDTDGASSIGNGTITLGYAPGGKIGGVELVYLGTGETVTRAMMANVSSTIPFTFAGGATGGLKLNGTITSGTTSAPEYIGGTHERYVFAGDHATPCEFGGGFTEATRGGCFLRNGATVTSVSSLAKRGAGTWIFRDNAARGNKGLVIVEEGTLQFESIAETNAVCSLGLGTMPMAEAWNANVSNAFENAENILPYNILLGGESNPVLEYIGATKGYCRTRPIAVTGTGTLKGSLDWAGVVAADPAEGGTLVLDGTATDSVLRDVDGVVIEKRGTGTWKLAGHQAPTSVKVTEGTLKVAAPVYTWFKLTIKNHTKGQDSNIAIQEIGFWDSDGNRIAVSNMVRAAACTQNSLKPGTGCWDQTMGQEYLSYYNTADPRCIENAFNDDCTTRRPFMAAHVESAKPTSANCPDISVPSSWVSLTMRLPEGSPAVAKYDLCSFGWNRGFDAWSLQGSIDGETWVDLDERSGVSTLQNKWMSDGTALTATQFGKGSPTGYVIPSAPAGATTINGTTVQVASGAMLAAEGETPVVLSALTLGASNGTLSGFALSPSGVVTVPAKADALYPLAFTNVTGVENIKNWTVALADGTVCKGYTATAVAGGILVSPQGTTLIVR